MKSLLRKLILFLMIFSSSAFLISASAIETASPRQCTAAEEQLIWEFLLELTGNPAGAAGIMGNLYCESHLLTDNLESHGQSVPSFDGLTYDQAADCGLYLEFSEDGLGFGLAQWTYPERKQRLLELAQEQGLSIADLNVQLALIAEELEQYNMLYRLSKSDSVAFTAEYVLVNFENPHDQNDGVKKRRAKISQIFYEKYAAGNPADALTDAQLAVLSVMKYSEYYGISAEDGLCQDWAARVVAEAGYALDDSPSAAASAERFGISEDFSALPPGSAIYGHSSTEYGHVGIYAGNGQVYHNTGGVTVTPLTDWILAYDGFCWGWIGGTDLTLVESAP